jgi:hypothetical protein
MRNRSLLGLHLLQTTFKVDARSPIALIHARYEHRCVGEQIFHLFERTLGGLGEEAVEEYGVGEIADLRMRSA